MCCRGYSGTNWPPTPCSRRTKRSEAGPWPLRVTPPGDGKLKIAVLGTLVNHKGARTVASVAEMADPATTEIHLIGHTDGPFSERAAERMKITGRYDDADLPGLIETIAPHLIWFPAVWPETFSYTLSAAIDAGIPIAATQIGAHTERLAGRPFTWLADIATSPLDWIRLFDEIRATLLNSPPIAAPPVRPAVADYLRNELPPPASGASPRAHASKPRIVVVPERFDIGFPTPCAYIRLLQPLHHPAVARGFDVRLATAETIFDHAGRHHRHPAVRHARRRNGGPPGGACASYRRDPGVRPGRRSSRTSPAPTPTPSELRPRAKIVRRMLDVADAVWLSTHPLAERLAAIRPDATVIPNGLDERIWTAAGDIVARSAGAHPVHGDGHPRPRFRHDRARAVPAEGRIRRPDRHRHHRHDHPERSSARPEPDRPAADTPRDPIPASSTGCDRWSHRWHIGLAPLLDTPFNLCKSPIKAMDYAALGLVVLASDTPVYRGSIADGPAGQLVPNSPAAWYAALNWLLRNRDERRTIATRSRDAFLAQASLASQAEIRRAALSRLPADRENHAAA